MGSAQKTSPIFLLDHCGLWIILQFQYSKKVNVPKIPNKLDLDVYQHTSLGQTTMVVGICFYVKVKCLINDLERVQLNTVRYTKTATPHETSTDQQIKTLYSGLTT